MWILRGALGGVGLRNCGFDFTKQPTLGIFILFSLSGRAPLDLSLEVLESQGFSASNTLPPRHAHNVTVPGAAAGWVDTIDKFGSGKVRSRLQSSTIL